MLPSNPRAGRSRSATRQPMTAQPRSASRPRERYPAAEDDRSARGRVSESSFSRQVGPQRSMNDVRPSRTRQAALPLPPPLPKSNVRSPASRPKPSASVRPPPSRDSDSSSSSASVSSSGTSFLDRMRLRGAPSSSSQSSFELDSETAKGTRGADAVRRPIGDGINPSVKTEQEEASNDILSHGYSFWNRVATAASAWAWNGTNNSALKGVGPSSGDSEITRVLKNYHINQARDRSDLPDWLFDERERGVDMDRPTQRSARTDEQNYVGTVEPVARSRGRGLRDIYDSVAAPAPEPRNRGWVDDGGQTSFGSGSSGPSKATDRLKALRDAKRQAANSNRLTEPVGGRDVRRTGSESVDGHDRRYAGSSSGRAARETMEAGKPVERMRVPRAGLPTNPRRR